jgi:hypothetical protein
MLKLQGTKIKHSQLNLLCTNKLNSQACTKDRIA